MFYVTSISQIQYLYVYLHNDYFRSQLNDRLNTYSYAIWGVYTILRYKHNTVQIRTKKHPQWFKSHLILQPYHINTQNLVLKDEFFTPITRTFSASAIWTTFWTILPLLKKWYLNNIKWRVLKTRSFQSSFSATNYEPNKYDWRIQCDLNLWCSCFIL